MCGLLAIALCALWVRSYWKWDVISTIDSNNYAKAVGSNDGTTYVSFFNLAATGSYGPPPTPHGWQRDSYESHPAPRFSWDYLPSGMHISMPTWLLCAFAMTLAVVPWLPLKRFSLRTLLIATTLVAVGLGLIVWMSQQ